MNSPDPLKQILTDARPHWDRDNTRPEVREAFTRALQCRTAELGAEVYGSENGEKILYHSCKARPCSSCGHRATEQWRRERLAALPDMPYKGVTFTIPDVLWPVFRDNPSLLKALPALAATVLKTRMSARHDLRVGVIAILHTFNGQLDFNSHVHALVTGGGLNRASDVWVSRVYIDQDRMMGSWRKAVIALLRSALRAGQLHTPMSADQVEGMLALQEKRWWSSKIQSFASKEGFLKYAGRYVRRPPIARRRITFLGNGVVRFWFNDKRQHKRLSLECSIEEFVDRWARHIPERYRHAVRSFGLFAPRTLIETSAAIFALLGQEQIPRPKPLPWADSLKRDFGRDPLLDHTGKRMKWRKRLAPVKSS
jgi:hypothetical protein